jgi:protein involved in polysaccharide export with SLBB domain
MTLHRNVRFFSMVPVLLLALSACGAARVHPTSELPQVPADPVVRPGDQLVLRVSREPEISNTYPVDHAGVVRVPRLGALEVGGRPVLGVQDSLRDGLSVYLRNPAVEVTVLRRVGLQGAVRAPNIYMVDVSTTLRELIAMAGGVTDAGNPGDIVIVRGEDRLRVPGGADARFTAAQLLSGDQVFVGERAWLERNWLSVAAVMGGLVPALFIIWDRASK